MCASQSRFSQDEGGCAEINHDESMSERNLYSQSFESSGGNPMHPDILVPATLPGSS